MKCNGKRVLDARKIGNRNRERNWDTVSEIRMARNGYRAFEAIENNRSRVSGKKRARYDDGQSIERDEKRVGIER